MKPSSILAMSLRSLHRAKIRSILTSLGIVIGVAAVVATTSIGAGAEAELKRIMALPGASTVYMSATLRDADSRRGASVLPASERIRLADYMALRAQAKSVKSVSPRVFNSPVAISTGGKRVQAILEGLDVGGLATRSNDIIEELGCRATNRFNNALMRKEKVSWRSGVRTNKTNSPS